MSSSTKGAGDSPATTSEEYVLIALPGVQAYVSEARTTADSWGASRLWAQLGREAVRLSGALGTVVIPSSEAEEVPNHILIRTSRPAEEVATEIVAKLRAAWVAMKPPRDERWVESNAPPGNQPHRFAAVAVTSSAPMPAAWQELTERLEALRRVRPFDRLSQNNGNACSLCGKEQAREGGGRYSYVRQGEKLCTTCVTKRAFGQIESGQNTFPSTSALASVPFRRSVLANWGRLRPPALAWAQATAAHPEHSLGRVTPTEIPGLDQGELPGADRFLATEAAALWAEDLPEATALIQAASEIDVTRPSPFYCILAIDGDRIGRLLSDGPTGNGPDDRWLSEVSRAMLAGARSVQAAIEDPAICGRIVYAAGDDIVALVPYDTALQAAIAARDALVEPLGHLPRPRGGRQTVTAALRMTHRSAPLRLAMNGTIEALTRAKAMNHRGTLTVAATRRTTELPPVLLGWSLDTRSVTDFEQIVDLFASSISQGLVHSLQKDRLGLSRLTPSQRRAAVLRLATRVSVDKTAALDLIGFSERCTSSQLEIEPLIALWSTANVWGREVAA